MYTVEVPKGLGWLVLARCRSKAAAIRKADRANWSRVIVRGPDGDVVYRKMA